MWNRFMVSLLLLLACAIRLTEGSSTFYEGLTNRAGQRRLLTNKEVSDAGKPEGSLVWILNAYGFGEKSELTDLRRNLKEDSPSINPEKIDQLIGKKGKWSTQVIHSAAATILSQFKTILELEEENEKLLKEHYNELMNLALGHAEDLDSLTLTSRTNPPKTDLDSLILSKKKTRELCTKYSSRPANKEVKISVLGYTEKTIKLLEKDTTNPRLVENRNGRTTNIVGREDFDSLLEKERTNSLIGNVLGGGQRETNVDFSKAITDMDSSLQEKERNLKLHQMDCFALAILAWQQAKDLDALVFAELVDASMRKSTLYQSAREALSKKYSSSSVREEVSKKYLSVSARDKVNNLVSKAKVKGGMLDTLNL